MNQRKEDRSGGYATFIVVALALYDIALLFVSNGNTRIE